MFNMQKQFRKTKYVFNVKVEIDLYKIIPIN